jgi:hypothetical protein
MAIGNVIQRGQTVYVYDDKGRQVSQHCAGSGGSVTGYTSTTVNLKMGCQIYTFNEEGRQIGSPMPVSQ